MAVDRQAMLQNVFEGRGMLAVGPLPRAHPAADPSVRLPAFDRARAGQLLDSAGWRLDAGGVRRRNGRPLAFSMLVPSSSAPRVRYAVLLQQAFRDVGAQVTIDEVDFPTFFQRVGSGSFDAALHASGFDPSAGTMRQFWSAAAAGKGGGNIGAFISPAFDATLDTALAARDRAARRSALARATQLLVDEAPAVWLYDVLTMGARSTRVQPAAMRADAWWAGLADWYIPEVARPAETARATAAATP